MDNLINLIEIIIWPALALFLIWLVRKHLRSFIPLLQTVKYKDVEIKFKEDLNRIRDNVDETSQTGDELIIEKSKLYELIEISPALSVIEVWKRLEISARNKTKQLLPNDESFQGPLYRPLEYLDYKGALSYPTTSVLRDLKELRNQAIHAGAHDISRQDAIQYAEIATGIQKQIDAIAELPKAKLSALTILILQINCLIDSGKFNDITIDEVYNWIENKNIIPSLASRVGDEIDLSCYDKDGPYTNFIAFYHDQMYTIMGGYEGQHRRKWGVENLGLCLLLAWTNEIVQRGKGWHPIEL